MARFRMPPLDPADPSSLQFALDQIELFLNSFAANAEAYLLNGPEQNLKVIRGSVSTAGGVATGSGFSAAKNGTGDYTVTYDEAFSDTPSVTANAVSTTAKLVAVAVGSTTVRFRVFTDAGAASDAQVFFTAIGAA